jgi:hypothetical protein
MLLKNILSKFAYKIHLLFPSLLKINKLFYYLEPNKPITSELFDLSDNTYLSGYWQSEKYFRNIKEHLVEELSLFNLPSVENEKYLIEIFNTNSVSIHIRRGDYINDTSAINTHGFCGLDYYVNSISFIESKLSNPTYFVFSDDIDWARHNIKTKKNIFFIDTNFDKPEEDLRLMLNCKHNIIANSSFSWWAAWLNQNKEKIVITPKKWFADSKKSSIDLIPSEWLKI